MKLRVFFLSTMALAGVAILPGRLSAQTCAYSATLGLGGGLGGCFSFTLSQLGEDAALVSSQYWWNGDFAGNNGTVITNDPLLAGTQFFNDSCGSGGTGTFAFCTDPGHGPTAPNASGTNLAGEFVIGLQVPDTRYGSAYYWQYSGCQGSLACEVARNGTPAPAGLQMDLMQVSNVPGQQPGQATFLFAWEDLNTGCTAENPTVTTIDFSALGNGPLLDSQVHHCSTFNSGGDPDSDSDFNDSYILLQITGTLQQVTTAPEPVSMSLMAMGLVGIAGVSARRKKKS